MVQKKTSRIDSFDIIRGYLLIGIFLNHLSYYPNGLDWWAMRGGLFTSMAEGFFIVSGVMLGLVRGSKMLNAPFKKVAKLLFSRSFQLYVASVVLTLLFTWLAWTFYGGSEVVKPDLAPVATSWGQLIWETITLQYFYGWADYLRLYAVFIAASPIMMWLLRRGWWYVGLLISFAVWALFPDPLTTSALEQERAQLLSWQFLFFISMTIGFYWPQLQNYWSGLSKKVKRMILGTIWSLSIITLAYSVASMLGTMGHDMSWAWATPEIRHEIFVFGFDKEQLPLPRIALSLLWFWSAFAAVRLLEGPIKRWTGWLLIKFGQNSLYVYTVHAFMLFFVHIHLPAGSAWQNFLIAVSCLAVTWAMVHYKVLMKIIPR